MRMRKKKNCAVRMENAGRLLIREPAEQIGVWKHCFQNDNEIHVEIGCGKGNFCIGMAQKYPNVNFIGIEKCDDALLIALEKSAQLPIDNLRFISFDAKDLKEIFTPAEISRIYLNFSDPWPKSKHFKRRLTYKDFLDIYRDILTPDGDIHFKTDNAGLFSFSLCSFEENGFYLSEQCDDLHHSRFAEDNVMTEYEANFLAQGLPIHRVVASKQKK